jgi:hypothetical protein
MNTVRPRHCPARSAPPRRRRIGEKQVLLPQLTPGTIEQDVLLLKHLIESSKNRPVVDWSYPPGHVVQAATYVETGHKPGNVVITVRG